MWLTLMGQVLVARDAGLGQVSQHLWRVACQASGVNDVGHHTDMVVPFLEPMVCVTNLIPKDQSDPYGYQHHPQNRLHFR